MNDAIPASKEECSLQIYSGFLHVMMANLIRPFLYPSIINGITSAPLMVFIPDQFMVRKIQI
jgi:hypothetical protein